MKPKDQDNQQGKRDRNLKVRALSSKIEDNGNSLKQGYPSLATLRLGERGTIAQIHCDGLLRRRLLDLGLVPGTLVEAVMASPWGDPVAYRVRGSLLAIRREDAERIEIQLIPEEEGKK